MNRPRLILIALVTILVGSVLLLRYDLLPRVESSTETSAGGVRAPEFVGIDTWLNTDPLTLSDLSGKVVLIDFWTYTCVNCQRTFPFIRSWHEKYSDDGLVIVGVHSPEFEFEKDVGNVTEALNRYGIQWAVAMDNEMATWNAYGNRYWPRKYLIDRDGNIRYDHIGEGAYNETESVIQKLLSETGDEIDEELTAEADVPISASQTPELYAGNLRGGPENDPIEEKRIGTFGTYEFPESLEEDRIYLDGAWSVDSESSRPVASSAPGDARLDVRYTAKDVFVVTGGASDEPYRVLVTLDGEPLGEADAGDAIDYDDEGNSYIDVDLGTLYNIISTDGIESHRLSLTSGSDEFSVFAFTFGS